MTKTDFIDELLNLVQRFKAGEGVVSEKLETQYRPDGFSIETSEWGGRRHRLVDEAIDALIDNGKADIAEEADAWFVFREEDAPELLAETEEKRQRARYAVDRSLSVWIQRGQPFVHHAPYKAKLANPEPRLNRSFRVIDGHAVVYLGARFSLFDGWERNTAQNAMKRYAGLLRRSLD